MRDEHALLREARLTIIEELVCRVYAILLVNEHDPQRALIQFSEGIKQQICPSLGVGNESTAQAFMLWCAIGGMSCAYRAIAEDSDQPGPCGSTEAALARAQSRSMAVEQPTDSSSVRNRDE